MDTIQERSIQTVYVGKRSANHCTIRRIDPDGTDTMLFPGASRKIRDHSPTGFEWGYGGSGPAQTALALCLDFTGDPNVAQDVYQDFKFQIVGGLGPEWTLSGAVIKAVINSILEKQSQGDTQHGA